MSYYKRFQDGRQDWRDIPGSFYIECAVVDGRLLDSHTDKELPEVLFKAIKKSFPKADFAEDVFEVCLNFLCSGGYTPARLYGPPENCSPAEYEDERLNSDCIIARYSYDEDETSYINTEKVVLNKGLTEELFEIFRDKIENTYVRYEDYEE